MGTGTGQGGIHDKPRGTGTGKGSIDDEPRGTGTGKGGIHGKPRGTCTGKGSIDCSALCCSFENLNSSSQHRLCIWQCCCVVCQVIITQP